jgi:prepilin-type processing-associated H-X9-DG protein
MKPIAGLVGLRRGGFNVAMGDGSAQFFSEGLDADVLLWLFQRADGNAIPDLDAPRPADARDAVLPHVPEAREEAIPEVREKAIVE